MVIGVKENMKSSMLAETLTKTLKYFGMLSAPPMRLFTAICFVLLLVAQPNGVQAQQAAAPAAPVITSLSQTLPMMTTLSTEIMGTAEPNVVINVWFRRDGLPINTPINTVSNSAGNWNVTASLMRGVATVTANARTSAATPASADSNAITFALGQPPNAPSITTPNTTVSGDAGAFTFTIKGMAGAGETITIIRVRPGNIVRFPQPNVAVANGDGEWSIDVSLAEAGDRFVATATDSVGLTSADSNRVVIVLDRTPPFKPIISTQTQTVSEASFTLAGTTEAGASIQLLRAGNVITGATATATTRGAWTITFELMAGENVITATATDSVGNGPSAVSDAVIITLQDIPAVTITSSSGGNGNTVKATILFYTVRFSKTVSNFVDSEITVSGTANGNSPEVSSFAGNGVVYTFQVVKGSSDGTVIVSIAAGVAQGNGQGNGQGNTASNIHTLTIDSTAPPKPVISTTSQRVSDKTTFTVSGAADGGATLVRLFKGSEPHVLTPVRNGLWRTDVLLTDGANEITAIAQDVAGNTSEKSDAITITLQDIPAVTITSSSGNSGDTVSAISLRYTVTFDGIVEGFVDSEIMVSGTANNNAPVASGIYPIKANKIYAFEVRRGASDGTVIVSIAAGVAQGNGQGNTASNIHTLTIDSAAPNPPVITLPATTTVNTPSFTLNGTAEAGATVQLSLLPRHTPIAHATTRADDSGFWTITFELMGATNTITNNSIVATATDIAGNTSGLSNVANITLDTVVPSVIIVSTSGASGSTVSATTLTYRANFSKAVSDFVADDIVVTGTANAGALEADNLDNFQGRGKRYTFDVIRHGNTDGTVIVSIPAGRVNDNAGHPNTASNQYTLTIDTTTTPPVIMEPVNEVVAEASFTFTGTAEAGATVRILFDIGRFVGASGVADNNGVWEVTVPLLSNEHTYRARATDALGNISALSDPVTITLDMVPPKQPVITTREQAVNEASFTVRGFAEAGASIQLLRAGVAIADATAMSDSNRSWAIPVLLMNGANIFTVTATDAAGNTFKAKKTDSSGNQLTSNTVTITLDMGAPSAPVITGLADRLVSTVSFTLSGTAEAGASIQLLSSGTAIGLQLLSSGTVVTRATATATGGAWTITFNLEEGENVITATATDGAGNLSVASEAVTITLDTTAPTVIITSLAGNSQFPPVTTNRLRYTATFSEVVDVIGASNITVTGSATNSGAAIISNEGAVTFIFEVVTTSDGYVTVLIAAGATRDGAGNKNVISNRHELNVDRTAPAIPVIRTRPQVVSEASFTLTGINNAGSTVELFSGDVSLGLATLEIEPSTGDTWTLDVMLLEEAPNVFTAKAIDPAGNISGASAAVTITLDTMPPAAPVITVSAADTFTNTALLTLSGTAEEGATVELFRGAGSIGVATVTGTTWSIDVTLNDGANVFTARATDAASHTSTPSGAVTITLDTMVPAAPVITTPANALVDTASLTLSGTAEAGATVDVLKSGTSIGAANVTGANWTFAVTLTEGDNEFTATATDAASNTSEASNAVTITLDIETPNAPVITPPNNTSVNMASFMLSGTAEAGASVQLLRAGVAISSAIATATGGAWTITFNLELDENVITATATDVGSKISAPSDPVTITLDMEAPNAPMITEPADRQVNQAGVNQAGFILRGTAALGTTVELFRDDTSLGMTGLVTADTWVIRVTLVLGDNVITAKAIDPAGNLSAASNAVTITLDRTKPGKPFITPPNNTSVNTAPFMLSGTAEAGASVQLWRAGSAISGATATATTRGAWTIPFNLVLGENVITAIATHAAADNPSAASNAVTITLDMEPPPPPGIRVPSLSTNTVSFTLAGTVEAGATVDVRQGGASIGAANVTGANWTFAVTLTEGANEFTATATDAANNTSAPSDAVTITLDITAPVITLMGNGTLSTTLAMLSDTAYTDEGATADDNLDGNITDSITTTITFKGNAVGAVNSVGIYTISYNVSDAAGNAATTVTRIVTVTKMLIIGVDTKNAVATPAGDKITILFFEPPAINGAVANDFTVSGAPSGTTVTELALGEGDCPTIVTALALGEENDCTLILTLSNKIAKGATVNLAYTQTTGSISTAIGNLANFSASRVVTSNIQAIAPEVETASVNTAGNVITLTFDKDITINNVPNGRFSVRVAGVTRTGTVTGLSATGRLLTIRLGIVIVPNVEVRLSYSELAGDTSTITGVDGSVVAAFALRPITNANRLAITTKTQTVKTVLFTLEGTVEAGSTVDVLKAGASASSEAIATGTTWSLAVTLTEGANEFTATDGTNTSAPSNAVTITLDTIAPTVAFSTQAQPVNTASFTLEGTVEAGSTVELASSSNAIFRFVAVMNGAWSNAVVLQNEGANEFTARATDAAGNTASATATIMLDTIEPMPPVITTPATAITLVNTASFTLEGTADTDITTVELFNGSAPLGDVAVTDGAWTKAVTLNEGANVFTATATDAVGNPSEVSEAVTITLDTTAPTATITSTSGASGSTVSATTLNYTATFDEDVTGFDELSDITVTGMAGVMSATNLAASSSTVYTFDVVRGSSDGSVIVSIAAAAAMDSASSGNTASSAYTLTIDTMAPAAPVITTPGSLLTNTTLFTLSGTTTSDTTTVALFRATAMEPFSLGTAMVMNGAWTITVDLAEGENVITATATDAVGNPSAVSNMVTITLDTIAPTVTITTPARTVNEVALTLAGTAEADATVDVLRSGAFIATVTAMANGAWSIEVTLSTDNNGANTFTATATDAAGNIATSEPVTITRTISSSSALVISDISTAPNGATDEGRICITLNADVTFDQNFIDQRKGNFVLSGGTPELMVIAIARCLSGATSLPNTVRLTLNRKIRFGETITLSYTKSLGDHNARGIRKVNDGEVLADFPARTVTNNAMQGLAIGTVQISAQPNQILLIFGESATISADLAATDFAVSGAASNPTVTSINRHSTTAAVALNLSANIAPGETITLTYTKGTGSISGTTTGDLVSFADYPVINNLTTPVVLPAKVSKTEINAVGDAIMLTFDKGISVVGTPASQFTVTVTPRLASDGSGSETRSVTTVRASGAVLTIGLAASIAHGNYVEVNYTPSAVNKIVDVNNVDVAKFSGVNGITIAHRVFIRPQAQTVKTSPFTFIVTAERGATSVELFKVTGGTETSLSIRNLVNGSRAITVEVTLADGANEFIVKATDGAGRASTSNRVIITLQEKPIVSITSTSGDSGDTIFGDSGDTIGAATLNYTATFDEGVTGFNVNDITVAGTAGVTSATNFAVTSSTIYTFDVVATSDGSVIVSIAANVAMDLGSNVDDNAASNEYILTIDMEAPDAPVIATPANTLVNEASFTLAGTVEAGATVDVRQGGASIGAASVTGTAWSLAVTLTEGANEFTAIATDAAGNTSATSDAVTITLDTMSPAAPVITTPAANTSVNTVSFTLAGTAEAGATVDVLRSGASIATVTAMANGAWSIEVTLSTDNNGANTFTATATDAAMNTSDASPAVTITLDMVAPPVAIGITTRTVNEASFTLSGTVEAGATVDVLKSGTSIGAANVTGTDWTFAVMLTGGANTFTATATDAAGNTSAASDAVTITLDPTALIVSITSTSGASSSTVMATTLNYTATFSVAVTGFELSDITVVGTAGVTSATNFAVTSSTVYTFEVARGSLDGTVIVSIGAGSAGAGNGNAASNEYALTIDTTAPDAPVITTPAANTSVNTVSFTLAGTAEAGATVDVRQGGTSIGAANVMGTSWSLVVALTEGANVFTATARDSVGNGPSAVSDAVTITLDMDATGVTIRSTSGDSGSTVSTDTLRYTVTFSEVVTGFELSDITVAGTAGVMSATNFAVTSSTVYTFEVERGSLDGTVIVSIGASVAEDLAGNNNMASNEYRLTIDTTAPDAPVITTPANTLVNEASFTLSGTVEAGATVELFRGADSLGMANVMGTSWSLDVTLGDGANVFTARATDAAMNTSDASPAVTITLDMDATGVTITSTSGASGSTVSATTLNYTATFDEAVTGFELSDITVAGTAGVMSATNFAVTSSTVYTFEVARDSLDGTVIVSIGASVAEDLAGNNNIASSEYTLTIDTTAPDAPVITTPANTLVNEASFTLSGTVEAGATVDVRQGGTSIGAANVMGTSWSLVVTLTEGANVFTATATDSLGNGPSDVSDAVTITFGLTPTLAKTLNEAILPRLIHTMLASTMTALSHRVDAAFSAVPQTANLSLDGQMVRLDSQAHLSANLQDMLQGKLPAYIKSLQNDTMDWQQLLSNSSFVMPLNAGGKGGFGSAATVWGAGDYSNLSDKGWKGDVFSIQLGIDGHVCDDLLAGGLVSWSKGDVDYTLDRGGEYTHQITSVHPYMVRSSGNVNLWGSVGYGQGKLEIKQSGDAQRSSKTRLLSLSTGVTSQLLQSGLSLKSDLALAQINIDGSTDNSIASQKLASQRLRLLLEIAKERRSASGLFKPVMEVGVRYDGGDGESGVGAVLDFGLHYACATTGWTVEGKVHTLVGRKDYKEWGVQGQIHKQAGVGGQGLSFSMSPSYGNNDSGADKVWQQQLPAVSGDNGNSHGGSARLDVNMGYGLFTGGGLLTPYIETALGKTDRHRFGLRWKNHSRLDMNLFAEEQAGEYKVLLKSRIRF